MCEGVREVCVCEGGRCVCVCEGGRCVCRGGGSLKHIVISMTQAGSKHIQIKECFIFVILLLVRK